MGSFLFAGLAQLRWTQVSFTLAVPIALGNTGALETSEGNWERGAASDGRFESVGLLGTWFDSCSG
jgi:hypothetical protein